MEQQMLYRDMPTDDENCSAVAFDAEAEFSLEDGKLQFKYTPHITTLILKH